MTTPILPSWKTPPAWLRFLIIALLIVGIVFRFAKLEGKVYWHDEAYTSLRISGYTATELREQVFNGRVISVATLHYYQFPTPEKRTLDTIQSLAKEEPQHPPLYFVLARWWTLLWGNSIAVIRSFSALTSLLVFPAIYWLCLELFSSSLTGWIAIALTAISPFQLLFAQEAREYGLWSVTILLSCAALLRAIRRTTPLSWGLYAATVAVGLYTFPFTVLVVFGHGLYIVILEHCRRWKTLGAYLVAVGVGLMVFLPWLFLSIENIGATESVSMWTAVDIPLLSLLKTWLGNISRVFFDFNLDANSSLVYLIPSLLIPLAIASYSLVFLYQQTPKHIWLFIVILICLTPVVLIVPDLLLGGRRSSVSRYWIPSYLGLQLAVTYLLSVKLSLTRHWQRRIWQLISLALIIGGVFSCSLSIQSEVWWNKKLSNINPQIARIINQASSPLIVSSNHYLNSGQILSLSHLLKANAKFQLVVEPNIPQIPPEFRDVFLFYPSQNLRRGLTQEDKITLKPVHGSVLVKFHPET